MFCFLFAVVIRAEVFPLQWYKYFTQESQSLKSKQERRFAAAATQKLLIKCNLLISSLILILIYMQIQNQLRNLIMLHS